ncbi:heterokaryon incompatibility protein-domain-containing protein [Xylaria palmicola]|nr:heterokaryon incompatibility protein-domain-containing protein [Xylaria palmicola]
MSAHKPAQPFKHNPLNLVKAEIRLVRVRPSECKSFQCSIEHVAINGCPPYHALSYNWGPELVSRTLTIDGHPYGIWENLWEFWDHLYTCEDLGRRSGDSDGSSEIYLWIDQICIDQDNDQERNHQVELMTSIYRRAESVVIWVGSEDHESWRAVDFIQNRYAPWDRVVARAVTAFFARPYWSRLWIVQEVLLARAITVRCGCLTLEWTDLLALAAGETAQLVPPHVKPLLTSTKAPPPNSNPRNKAGDTPVRNDYYLEEALVYFSGRSCTDLRDKIFGLVGIVRASDRRRVRVDYTHGPDFGWLMLCDYISGYGHSLPSDCKVDPKEVRQTLQLLAKEMCLRWEISEQELNQTEQAKAARSR